MNEIDALVQMMAGGGEPNALPITPSYRGDRTNAMAQAEKAAAGMMKEPGMPGVNPGMDPTTAAVLALILGDVPPELKDALSMTQDRNKDGSGKKDRKSNFTKRSNDALRKKDKGESDDDDGDE